MALRLHRKPTIIACALAGVAVLATGGVLLAPRFGIDIVPASPQTYADRAVDQMSDGLNATPELVASVRATVAQNVDSAEHYSDTYAALDVAAKTLGGSHSSFLPPADAKEAFDTENSGSTASTPTVTTESGITTITVPTLNSNDASVTSDYQSAITRGLVSSREQTTRGYIVDLRDNHGGDLWPMLAALAPLLTDGTVLSFDSATASNAVSVSGSDVVLAGTVQASASGAMPKTTVPVAVLHNGFTGSSAEAVAISFRGQPNARSFGEPTYGFSTANQARRMPDGAALNMTVAVDADRTGTRYGTPLIPDVVVTAPDQQLQAARQWLVS